MSKKLDSATDKIVNELLENSLKTIVVFKGTSFIHSGMLNKHTDLSKQSTIWLCRLHSKCSELYDSHFIGEPPFFKTYFTSQCDLTFLLYCQGHLDLWVKHGVINSDEIHCEGVQLLIQKLSKYNINGIVFQSDETGIHGEYLVSHPSTFLKADYSMKLSN